MSRVAPGSSPDNPEEKSKMIRFLTDDAKVVGIRPGEWHVVHPSNDAILATANTKHEAERAVDALNDMARQLRDVGEKVA
jgi:hypothetical protein